MLKKQRQAINVNSKNCIVDRHYWRRNSLTITGSFVGRKVDYMKAHDYNSTGRVHEIAVQFVQERRIHAVTCPSLSSTSGLYQPIDLLLNM